MVAATNWPKFLKPAVAAFRSVPAGSVPLMRVRRLKFRGEFLGHRIGRRPRRSRRRGRGRRRRFLSSGGCRRRALRRLAAGTMRLRLCGAGAVWRRGLRGLGARHLDWLRRLRIGPAPVGFAPIAGVDINAMTIAHTVKRPRMVPIRTSIGYTVARVVPRRGSC